MPAQSPGARLDIRGQLCGALERFRLGRDTAAAAGEVAGVLERGRDPFVRPIRCRGELPRAPVRLGGRDREGGVRGPPVRRPRELVDRRAGERVGKRQSLTDQESCALCLGERLATKTLPLECLPQRSGVAGVSGCDEEERPPRLL